MKWDFLMHILKAGFSTFTLEDNIRYLKEFRLGEPMQPAFSLYNVNNKLVHIVGGLYDKEDALCAIFETSLRAYRYE